MSAFERGDLLHNDWYGGGCVLLVLESQPLKVVVLWLSTSRLCRDRVGETTSWCLQGSWRRIET